jgi:ATP-dependent RNA helicase DDX19/DBP5
MVVMELIEDESMLPRGPQAPQIILFSATFPDHVRAFANKFAPNANKIELQKNEVAIDSIRQFYMDCRNEEHKYDILVSLYSLLTIGQSIIFTQVLYPLVFKCIYPLTAYAS